MELDPPGDAMIEASKLAAVRQVKAMDHPGFQIGDEELPVVPVQSEISQARTGIGAPLQRHIGKNLRPKACLGVQAVDCAGTAAAAPHSGHPVAVIGVAMQTEHRGGGDNDVGAGVADGDPEDLAGVKGRHRGALRGVRPMLSPGRYARPAKIDYGADNTLDIDHRGPGATGGSLHGCAGKSGGKGLARR